MRYFFFISVICTIGHAVIPDTCSWGELFQCKRSRVQHSPCCRSRPWLKGLFRSLESHFQSAESHEISPNVPLCTLCEAASIHLPLQYNFACTCLHDWGTHPLPPLVSPSLDLVSHVSKVSNAVGLGTNAKRRPDIVSVIRMKDR